MRLIRLLKTLLWKVIFNILISFKPRQNVNLPPLGVRFHFSEKGKPVTNIIKISSDIKYYNRSTICIKEKGKIYKIISISASKKDGSINMYFPYFAESTGFVEQHYHKYKAGEQILDPKKIFKKCVIGRTAKLSLHQSGFVQLSGNGIISGIDTKTRMAKGIGLFSSPLKFPVYSGPTVSFKCFGVEKGFDQLISRKRDVQYIILNKNNNDFIERKFSSKEKINSYLLEFFIFPKEAKRHIFYYNNKPFINHIIPNYIHQPNIFVAHPVLDIKYFEGVIGIFPILIYSQFADEFERGYVLNSPGGSMRESDLRKTGTNFHWFNTQK